MSKTLLLADDSVTIQKVVGISFANEDVKLVTVDNGDAAVEQARALRPDVVLADVVMPGKNGYEVCEALKSDPRLRHVPVLLLTGTFEAFDEERARRVGADGHITKPFEAQALVDQVNALLARAPIAASAPAEPPETAPIELEATASDPSGPGADAYPFFEQAVTQPDGTGSLIDDAVGDLDEGAPSFAFDETPDLEADFDLAPPAPRPPAADTYIIPGALEDRPARTPAPAPSFDDEDRDELTMLAPAPLVNSPAAPRFTPPPPVVAAPPPPPPRPVVAVPPPPPPPAAVPAFDSFDTSTPGYPSLQDLTPPPTLRMERTEPPAMPPQAAPTPRPSDTATRPISGPSPSPFEMPTFPGVDAPAAPAEDPLVAISSGGGFANEAVIDPAGARSYDVSSSDLGDTFRSAASRPPKGSGMEEEITAPQSGRRATPVADQAPGSAIGTPGDSSRSIELGPAFRQEIRDAIEKIAWEAFGQVTEKLVQDAVDRVERVAWEVVPQIAETLVKEEIRRMKGD